MKLETPNHIRSTGASPEPSRAYAHAPINQPRSQSTLAKAGGHLDQSDRKSPFDMMKGISQQLANVTVVQSQRY